MVNQLIQKNNKPPIVKTEIEKIFDSISSSEKRIKDGFTTIDYQRGLKNFNNLKSENDSLSKIYNNTDITNSLVNLERIKKLTDSLYSQGLNLFISLLNIVQQVDTTDSTKINDEIIELQKQLESCSDILKPIITERIEKNKNAIKKIKSCNDKVDELFCEIGLCKDSIREIRLELPELVNHKSKDEYDKVVLELDTRINFAQRVSKEYTRQGL